MKLPIRALLKALLPLAIKALPLLTPLLSRLSPFAKAVAPAAAALLYALGNMAASGQFDSTSIVALSVGLVSSIVVYLVPNKPRSAAPATTPAVPTSPSK